MKTLSELLKLSQSPTGRKKLSIMLAPLVGWTSRLVRVSGVKKPIVLWFGPNGESNREAPSDFHSDLNACHTVEAGLGEDQCDIYLSHIDSIDTSLHPDGADYPAQEYWFHSSALQRTIALILTLQKPEPPPIHL